MSKTTKSKKSKVEAKPVERGLSRSILGRPPKYADALEMQEKIQEYFDDCPDKRTIITPIGAQEVPCPTITGLVIFLGFDSRQSFYDYEEKPEFSYTIKRARSFMEREYEKLLQAGNATGAIFALKNFGWSDKQQIEVSDADIATHEKIKEFLNDTNDGAYDDVGSESASADEDTGDSEMA